MADGPSPLESAVLESFPWLIGGLLASIPLLTVPSTADRRAVALAHLVVLVLFSLGLTWRVAHLSPAEWYPSKRWSAGKTYLAGAVSLIVVVTGATALVTLASSAALRLQPSLQFLQLLSALDIAWVVAGTTLATRSLWGRGAALAAGIGMSAICVGSIALYLAEVGLDETGGWLVDSDQMLRLVIPFDVAAAVLTVGLTLLAASLADGASKTPVV